MTRTTLPLLLLVGLTACKFGWSDTGDDEQDAVQTRSFDYDVSSIILSDNGAVGVMSTSEGVVAFDSWTGDGQGATAPGDFTEANVEDWYDDRVLIVDRDADAGVFIWEPGVVGYEMHEDDGES